MSEKDHARAMIELPWYVVHTAGGTELALRDRIRAAGRDIPDFYCFVPQYLKRSRIHGEERDVERVFFTGYIFLCMKDPEAVLKLLTERKIWPQVLRAKESDLRNEYYLPLYDHEKELLLRLLELRGKENPRDTVGVSIGVLKDGRLKVIDGPMCGLEQYVISLNRHRRKAILKMELFGEIKTITMSVEVVGEE